MSPKPAADPMSDTPATPTPWLHRLRVWNGEEPDFEELAPDFCAGSAAFANDVKAALRAHATLLHQRDALVKALEPFVKLSPPESAPDDALVVLAATSGGIIDVQQTVTVGSIRRARATLASIKE